MKKKKKINIYLTKTELSQYNYFFLKYLFSKFEKQKLFNLVIISTNYSGKKYYRENTNFFKNIKWIDKNKLYNWDDLKLECPDILFQSGWTVRPFKYLGKITRKINKNCKIILTADNSYKLNNIRQILGKYYFYFFLKRKFDFVWVPGKSGKKLMLNFGMNENKIFTGLYSSLIQIYKNKTSTNKRKKQFLFVGQFIKRKNIEILIRAFDNLRFKKKKEWKLILVGRGSLNFKSMPQKNIKVISYSSPSKLLKLYNESLFFILPPLEDHWPLVVHEASLCGCFLLLSDRVGNIFEFANNKNSIIFNPKSEYSIKNSLKKAMLLSKDRLKLANKTSEFLGKKNNYDNSYRQFVKIITKCLGKNYAK